MKPDPFARAPKPIKQSSTIESETNYKEPIPSPQNGEPYPWLFAEDSLEELDKRASFVEYLRWMRSPDKDNKDDTKLEIIQRAVTNANYYEYLTRANQRIRDIAGEQKIAEEEAVFKGASRFCTLHFKLCLENLELPLAFLIYLQKWDAPVFKVTCPWRIRVGGHRGPESILLPAFDALGIPYIPSSTLRGVARNQAIRYFMEENGCKWEQAEEKVASWFGSLDAKDKCDRMGKVIFLDAYPVAKEKESKDGLAMDMVNNIWKWEKTNSLPTYNPNPNLFLSLQEPTFLIGLKKGINCSDDNFIKVKNWLIAGLQAGVGSQINSGYGQLSLPNASESDQLILKVKFTLKGQLIHGISQYSEKNLATGKLYKREQDSEKLRRNKEGQLIADTQPEAELRPIAFKSMLRYWFRAFALGQLPGDRVKHLEAIIFGAIEPKTQGWLKVQIINPEYIRKTPENSKNGYGEIKGKLLLFAAKEITEEQKDKEIYKKQKDNLIFMMKTLTWMMFHLGGVGQGARRPCYYRGEKKLPWRGSTLIPDRTEGFWQLPDDIEGFIKTFRKRIKNFYQTLEVLNNFYAKTNQKKQIKLSPQPPRPTSKEQWFDAVDRNCKIIVYSRNKIGNKVYPLSILHKDEFKKDKNVCGNTEKPSAVWIADLGKYQVVTIFGIDHNPRQKYLSQLKNVKQIFPILDKYKN